MRHISSILLAMFLILALAGCGDKQEYHEGRIGDSMETYFFNFTVNDAYTCSEYGGYTPDSGNTLLVVELTVKNTDKSSITMWDSDFQVQWSDDSEDAYAYPVPEADGALSDDQLPSEYDLGIGRDRTGVLVFEVPKGEKDFSILYLEFFNDGSEDGKEGDLFAVFFTADETSL